MFRILKFQQTSTFLHQMKNVHHFQFHGIAPRSGYIIRSWVVELFNNFLQECLFTCPTGFVNFRMDFFLLYTRQIFIEWYDYLKNTAISFTSPNKEIHNTWMMPEMNKLSTRAWYQKCRELFFLQPRWKPDIDSRHIGSAICRTSNAFADINVVLYE